MYVWNKHTPTHVHLGLESPYHMESHSFHPVMAVHSRDSVLAWLASNTVLYTIQPVFAPARLVWSQACPGYGAVTTPCSFNYTFQMYGAITHEVYTMVTYSTMHTHIMPCVSLLPLALDVPQVCPV
jgi:hypothetical protein